MNSKLYIFLLPLITLLATSCWSAKISTAREVEIDTQEIGLQKWQSSKESWSRLAINDSIAWRRRTVERTYNDAQQLVAEVITEETVDHRHEEQTEAAEAADEEGEAATMIKKQEKKETRIKASGTAWPMLSAIVFVVLMVIAAIMWRYKMKS